MYFLYHLSLLCIQTHNFIRNNNTRVVLPAVTGCGGIRTDRYVSLLLLSLWFRYDEILVSGLPDWRQPVYYYRRVRKMGMLEFAILLSVILTTGHIITLWSIYLERRFEKVRTFVRQFAECRVIKRFY